MSDTPDFTMEPVWFVQCTYAPDAMETRGPFRAAHLDRCAELKRQGVIVEVGAYADISASVLLIRAETEAEALEICRQDVYMQNGIWVELRARQFNRLRLPDEGAPATA
ncbi:MAG TPA: YciI family protein [Candidatus Limnocylindrales bacterium]|jgi:uncharacterized protein YciI|nr:YciI family protein [Candidatus Limnocylindrales bacterium]